MNKLVRFAGANKRESLRPIASPPAIIEQSSPQLPSIPPKREGQLAPLISKDNFQPTPMPIEQSNVRQPVWPSILSDEYKPFPSNRVRHFPSSAVSFREENRDKLLEGKSTRFKKSGERHIQSSPVQYDPEGRRRQYHPSLKFSNTGTSEKVEKLPLPNIVTSPSQISRSTQRLSNLTNSGETTSEVPKPRFVESPPMLVPQSRVRHSKRRKSPPFQHAPKLDNLKNSNCEEPMLPEFKNATVDEKQSGESWAPLSWRNATVNTGATFRTSRDNSSHEL